MLKKIGLTGYALALPTIGNHQDRVWRKPSDFEWTCDNNEYTDTRVFLDHTVLEHSHFTARHKIALLREPFLYRPHHYEFVAANHDSFDAIFTCNKALLDIRFPNVYFYPFGGSFINDWGLGHTKNRLVSIITGHKNELPGHRLRHEIASRFSGMVDVYGEPESSNFVSKTTPLSGYLYSIVIENVSEPHFFTEKLIDAFSVGTIPIYWGCPSIDSFFNTQGMIPFRTMEQLEYILAHIISTYDYTTRFEAVKDNYEIAKEYECPEDWLSEHYPQYFT